MRPSTAGDAEESAPEDPRARVEASPMPSGMLRSALLWPRITLLRATPPTPGAQVSRGWVCARFCQDQSAYCACACMRAFGLYVYISTLAPDHSCVARTLRVASPEFTGLTLTSSTSSCLTAAVSRTTPPDVGGISRASGTTWGQTDTTEDGIV